MQCVYYIEEKPVSSFKKREHVIPQCFGRFTPDEKRGQYTLIFTSSVAGAKIVYILSE